MTLTNEGCDNGRVNYSLSIANITMKMDGLTVECGARNVTDTGDNVWYATHKTELAIGKMYILTAMHIVAGAAVYKPKYKSLMLTALAESHSTCVTTNTNFEIKVAIGGSITLNCSRVCGPRIFDRWRLYPEVADPVAINEDQLLLKEDFEGKTGVTLILSNEDYENCDGEMIAYSLTIANITRSVDGLIVECGARKTDPDDDWYATHKTKLHIGRST